MKIIQFRGCMDGGIYSPNSYGKDILSEKSFNSLPHISFFKKLLSSEWGSFNSGLYNLKNDLL